ncbi:MAG TPA: hypothetical protein VLF40_04115 [Candidatus Saccharimonadales bacterium]|nr:hypothetical protein [Candidatus Saccharimonadales bacterium]
MKKPHTTHQDGSILVTILVLMIFSTSMLLGLDVLANANLFRARGRIFLLQAQYSAESGADAAIATLNSGNTTYTGTTGDVQVLSTNQYKATYATTVAASGSKEIITATGKVYVPKTATSPTYTRKIRVTASQSSTTSATSILSRNIIEIASGVKNVFARDVYVNGYIDMAKNTTNLVAENITVAGKNTGATNCSIGGSGNLVKPTSFSNPGQTKTNITVAYNNCPSPPGNTSNADFNVSANNTSISTIQSSYIPWSYYMDNSYQNSPGGCADWTTGVSPRSIPSTGNTKKTHYPDSSSNIATSCGTNGDLSLGANTYTIKDNVHVRANFCATSGCAPTFNNPSSSVVYMFVEGTVNFTSVKTASGSGPIVLINYGADPASKTSVCPYGGALYLGQSGSDYTEAPALYMLAMNGLCIDGTKFGQVSDPSNAPMLGGVGGKNIYIASSPSTKRDLTLDPTFPVSSIPINLSWRESGYERL